MSVRILYNSDTFDAATITSSSEGGSYVDDYAVHDHIGLRWQPGNDDPSWIKFDFGSALTLTEIGFFGLSGYTSGATYTIEGHASDAWGAPSFSENLTVATDADSNVLPRVVHYPTAAFNYRWMRFVQDDGGLSPTVGRIKGGSYYEPARGIQEGWSISFNDPSEGLRVPGRQTFLRSREMYRSATVGFRYMSQTQRDEFETLFSKVGNHTPIILSLDPTGRPTKDSMYCYLKTPLAMINEQVDKYTSQRVVFEEITQ